MQSIMMDFDKMSGYDFEELITKLLYHMGFEVEQTSLSGDGGIDIVAYSKKSIFKGKYLVQCKRWSEVVGEPVVRDLYGVVLSQNANKGIVITNSYFSENAKIFAENKNIELIDGDTLTTLIRQYLYKDNDNCESKKHFLNNEHFEIDVYDYYKNQVETDKRNKDKHIELLRFLYSYLVNKNLDIMYEGLIDECLSVIDNIISRFCRRGKESLKLKSVMLNIKSFLHLLLENLDKSFQTVKELNCIFRAHPDTDSDNMRTAFRNYPDSVTAHPDTLSIY
ncbi:MAG: restriction endonuclease [Peptococcaceae bacterium]|nr:restriction endonuclease [Peptococcaceae bacterium]